MWILHAILMLAVSPFSIAAGAQDQPTHVADYRIRAAAMSANLLPFQATEKRLANGLKVIVVPTGFPNIAR